MVEKAKVGSMIKPIAFLKKKKASLEARLQAYADQRPHKSLRPSSKEKRAAIGGRPLPKLRLHVKDCFVFIGKERWLLAKLVVVYAIVSYTVNGLSQFDFVELKHASQDLFSGGLSAIANAGTLFLSATSGTLNSTATELQQFLGGCMAFLFWLVVVWTVRMRLAGTKIKVRDALYNSGAPIVPTLIVLTVVVIQLLPAAIGAFIYSVAQVGGFLQSGIEIMLFVFGALLMCVLSLYWLSGSILALVTVTLPGTYPWKALSAASRLVIGQRLKLAVRVVALVVITFGIWIVGLLPVLFLDAWLNFEWLPLVPVVVQLLAAFSLLFSSVYMYKVYRSLL